MKNILDLLREFGIQARRVGTYAWGEEYHSRCPRAGCAKEDGFWAWPDKEKEKGGFWKCNKCGKAGDGMKFLQEYKGFSYKQAKEYMGITALTHTKPADYKYEKPKFEPKAAVSPIPLRKPPLENTEEAISLANGTPDIELANTLRAASSTTSSSSLPIRIPSKRAIEPGATIYSVVNC